jgi:hypothetical protein
MFRSRHALQTWPPEQRILRARQNIQLLLSVEGPAGAGAAGGFESVVVAMGASSFQRSELYKSDLL